MGKTVWKVFFVVAALILFAGLVSPNFIAGPIKEQSHYLYVSFWMRTHQDYLSLFDIHGLYFNKGPLLFWLSNIFWYLFGLDNFSLRLLFVFLALLFCVTIKKTFSQYWPKLRMPELSVVVCFSSFYFLQYFQFYFHDLWLCLGVLVVLYGLRCKDGPGFVAISLGTLLGLLSKGPVTFIFTFPALILAPFFLNKKKCAFYFMAFAASLVALLLALSWVVLALKGDLSLFAFIAKVVNSNSGVGEYRYSERILSYLLSPHMLLPVLLWPTLWQAIKKVKSYQGLDKRYALFLLASIACSYIIMLLFPNRAARYLLPLLAPLLLVTSFVLIKGESLGLRVKPFVLLYQCAGGFFLIALALSPFINTYLAKHLHTTIALLPFVMVSVLGLFYSLYLLKTACKQNNLSDCLMPQLILSALMVAIYITTVANAYQASISQFNRCIEDLKDKPLAFVAKHYQFYFYNLNPDMPVVSDHTLFSHPKNLNHWRELHPKGYIFYPGFKVKGEVCYGRMQGTALNVCQVGQCADSKTLFSE